MNHKPHLIIALALALLLAACASPTVQTPPAAPTSDPAPTSAPVERTGLLPAAIYLLEGQIFRLAAEDLERSQVTDEVSAFADSLPIPTLAVSPADGSLAYVVQRDGHSVLVRSGPGGEEPQPIYEQPGVLVSGMRFTPDGTHLAVLLSGDESFTGGIYLLPAVGGEPQLLVANDPQGDLTQFDPSLRTYFPARFSPDGALLLTYQGYAQLEGCDLAIVRLADGAVTQVQFTAPQPDEMLFACSDSLTWAPDSSALYFTPIRIGAPLGDPTLWRADAATGASAPLTPAQGAGPLTLYSHPFALADGTLLALTAQVAELPPSFSEEVQILSYAISRIDPATGATEELRPATSGNIGQVAWAPDGSGLASFVFDELGDPALLFIPAGPGEPVLIAGGAASLFSFAWAYE